MCRSASEQVTEPIIGNFYEMTQPIQMRFNELLSGARSEVAVAIYGDDLDQMGATAKRVAARAWRKSEVWRTCALPRPRGFPSLDVKFDRNAIARYGLTMEDVADTVAAALGGRSGRTPFQRRPALPDRRARSRLPA